MDWFQNLAVELLQNSPSLALRSCRMMAELYPPLARGLFNVAFISCWTALPMVPQKAIDRHGSALENSGDPRESSEPFSHKVSRQLVSINMG